MPRARSLVLPGGGLLALAGALMQVLLRNPLADPYVLEFRRRRGRRDVRHPDRFAGVRHRRPELPPAPSAPCSWSLAGARRRQRTQTWLLLTGVIVAAGCGALVALMLAIAEGNQLRGMFG